MAKKVLIISGSPRTRGNSDILCDEFKRGALETGNEVEKIRLRDKKINYCMGCGVCNATGKCVQKDDMAELLQKMIEADVIVLATPVYFYAMNGQMKTFIDRTVPQYTKISNKDFYFIVTSADTIQKHLEKVVEGLRGFAVDCLDNTFEKGVVYGLGAWQKGEIEHNQEAMRTAYEFGKNV